MTISRLRVIYVGSTHLFCAFATLIPCTFSTFSQSFSFPRISIRLQFSDSFSLCLSFSLDKTNKAKSISILDFICKCLFSSAPNPFDVRNCTDICLSFRSSWPVNLCFSYSFSPSLSPSLSLSLSLSLWVNVWTIMHQLSWLNAKSLNLWPKIIAQLPICRNGGWVTRWLNRHFHTSGGEEGQ
jgi:hypothetical protein